MLTPCPPKPSCLLPTDLPLALGQHRFSIADFRRLAETGILAEDARVELIDLAPIGSLHGGSSIVWRDLSQ